ncbi:LysE/ArgO family amino acid transporter [Neorhizobium petrolearium]|uniref:LysE/ArgO family amino acid transporter n=1 Tax=Neorhizobium petrolearium TaxID=515361 RepID=A0ABY8M958_9HYPH|nr:LysE/ArgO family amino acid transporter [Neorhizobium petrolearium]MCC2609168.1 LysE/ArgO family amino acid transporter [Neorhizobium petrolearium]WGI71086.1 LysE/ArgO family amino acid transporter [Neorhizobium petrolearium]
MFSAGFSGLALGGSLIVAIGAQNAFILRQGLIRSHVFILCLICALSDALLIAAGVGGLGTIVAQSPVLIQVVTLCGAVFLGTYSVMAFRRAAKPGAMVAGAPEPMGLKAAVLTCLAFTFLNPHVYLDTVVLLGSLSAAFEGTERVAYGAGAAIASCLWFFGLGYGARFLAPFFARPAAWRVLDVVIGVVMGLLALGLLLSFLGGE